MPRDLIPSEIRDFSTEQDTGVSMFDGTLTELQQTTFLNEAREMIMLRVQKTRLEAREAELKKQLMATLEEVGEPYGPEGQHRSITFDVPIRNIVRFVRQRKNIIGRNEHKAEAIARDKGIYDRLFTMVPVLDEDAVMVAVEQGLITEAELAEIFPKKIIHAFVMEKEKK